MHQQGCGTHVIFPEKHLLSPLLSLREAQSRQFVLKLLVGVLLINILAMAYAGLNLYRSRQDSLLAAETHSQTIAQAVDQSMSSNIGKIDIALQIMVNEAEQQLAQHGALQPKALAEMLQRQQRILPESAGGRIFDASGHIVAATGTPASAKLDVSRRPYFLALQSGSGRLMYISRPLASTVSQEWAIIFARRYRNAAGQFAGVVLIPIKIAYFSRLLKSFDLSASDATSLRYSDLSLIASYPALLHGKVSAINSRDVSPELAQIVASGVRQAVYHTGAPHHAEERINTFYRLGPTPLFVVAGVDQAEYLRSWNRQLWQTIIFLVVFMLVSLFLAGLVLHYRRKQLQAMRSLTESHEQLDRAQEAGLLGTYFYDFTEARGIASVSLYSMIGVSPDTPFSIEMWEELIHPEDLAEARIQLDQAIQNHIPTFSTQHRILRKNDGQLRWVSTLSKIEYDPDGAALSLSGVAQDVGARKLTEERLRLTQEVFLHSIEGIFVADSQGQFLEINPAFTRLTGYTPSDVRGKTPSILKSGRHSAAFYQEMWQTLLQTGHWEGELQNRRKDGSCYTQFARISSVRDRNGTISRFICMTTDEMQSRMEYLAYFDQLTGLPNRARFIDYLQQALDKLPAEGESLAVCYLDLDGFKQINDEWGLRVGDGILQEIGRRLQSYISTGGQVARIAGDEFVVLLEHLYVDDALSQVMDGLHATLGRPVVVEQITAKLTISVGVTLYPRDGADNPDALIRNANQAMYIAKQTGKNRTHQFDAESERRLRENQDLLSEILQAFEQNVFQLYYQPKVDMRSGQVIGAEALLRWPHPQQGMIPPDVFLPLVENTEFSVLLGEWVLRQAMAQMSAWASAGLVLPVSVNISAYHLQRADFVDRLAGILSEFPLVQPGWLELEILETTAMEDLDQIAHLLDACMALGVHFSLDDFGTGYSSLTYLRCLPVETIKIDRSFVIDMLSDSTDHALVEGIIGLARSLQREVIAEGVESFAHGLPLLRMGCHLAQGYGIALPMRADKVQDWVAQWRVPALWKDVEVNASHAP